MSTIQASNVSDGTLTLGTETVIKGSSKSWVHGSSAAVAVDSYNVASGTDHGVGDYSYTFTNAMSDANYAQQSAGRAVDLGLQQPIPLASQQVGWLLQYGSSLLRLP